LENAEGDLDHYALYRAVDAADLRSMTLRKRLGTDPEGSPRPGEELPLRVLDGNGTAVSRQLMCEDLAPPGVTWHYRLVAVDEMGNVSAPSAPVGVRSYRPPPTAPHLLRPAWDAAHETVTLTWTSPDFDLESLVERRGPHDLLWTPTTGWLSRGTYTHVDVPTDPTAVQRYRIKVRDPLGQVNTTYIERSTP
jgi:hypothetical protein